jgi:hypothetical protein
VNPRNAHGIELEIYFVYTTPVAVATTLQLAGLTLEDYPTSDGLFRAARGTGDVPGSVALETLRAMLLSGQIRWLELGLRGYSLMEKRREYRPWRKNAHLTLEAFTALTALEPEVRYHAPV